MPSPVTIERVAEQLEELGVIYETTPDGNLRAGWATTEIIFGVDQFSMQVNGQPRQLNPNVDRGLALLFVDEMNRKMLWPCMVASMEETENGQAPIVRSQYALPIQEGMTDKQLSLALKMGVEVTNQAYSEYAAKLLQVDVEGEESGE